MTTTENPAIGQDVEANGIRTNYLESGSGDQHVVLVHGSGPGVTSYANWRLVLPELGKRLPLRRAGHGRVRLLRPARTT